MVPEVQVDPLLPEHRKKRGEQRGREASVEQRLDGDDLGRRAGPGDGAGVGVGEEGIVHGVDQDSHVGGSHLVRVGFQLGLDIYDESRTDCGE